MKININIGIWSLTLLLSGGLMAQPLSQNWVTIKDKERRLQADFPHEPLEMTFEVPFQNTPSTSQIHLYSVPTQAGIFVLSTFTSPSVTPHSMQKEELYQFFESYLVPYFFFNPTVFQDQQVFTYQPLSIKGEDIAAFQFSYHDHGTVKNLEGHAQVKENTLYIYFYLASEKAFDRDLFTHFIDSVQVLEENT